LLFPKSFIRSSYLITIAWPYTTEVFELLRVFFQRRGFFDSLYRSDLLPLILIWLRLFDELVWRLVVVTVWGSPFTLLKFTETLMFLEENDPSYYKKDPGSDRCSISLRGTFEIRFDECPSPPTVFFEMCDFTLLKT
jgi:hypothetical protein